MTQSNMRSLARAVGLVACICAPLTSGTEVFHSIGTQACKTEEDLTNLLQIIPDWQQLSHESHEGQHVHEGQHSHEGQGHVHGHAKNAGKVHRRLQSELIELRDYKVLLREYRRVRLEKLSETLGKVQDGRRLRHCVRVMIRNGAQRILQRLEHANLPLEPWMREVLLNCCYVEIRIEDAETQLLSLRREALKPVREDVQQMIDKTKAERFEDLFVRTLELRQQKLSTTASSEQLEEKTMQMEPESACGDSVAPSNIGGESTSDFGSDMQRTKEKDNTPAVPIEKVRADVRALEGEITSLRRLLGDMRANAAAVICNHLRQAEKSAARNWSPKEAAAWGHRMLSLLVSEDFATTTMKELLKLSPLRY